MTSLLLVAAALTAALTFCVHVFIGGRVVARPLLASTALPPASKWLNYFCWHVTSLLLALLVPAFAWAARADGPESRPLIAFLAALCLGCSALSAVVALKGEITPRRFPSTSLFLAIGLLAGAALAA